MAATSTLEQTPTKPASAPACAAPARPGLIAAGGWAYSGAIGLSACLLFTLELMVGLLLLPLLGGATSVWATTLGFFQLILLLGYLYAHVSVTRLGRLGPIVHFVLAIAAVAALVFGPKMSDINFDTLHPVLQVLATLTVAVGLPSFVLCATTPLLSAWLTTVLSVSPGTAIGAGKDPYRLYVVSNAGSLLALLAYPLVIEPALGLGTQRIVWGACFGLLVVLLTVVGALRVWASSRVAGMAAGAAGGAASARPEMERIAARRVARWLFLAAVPCGLLSAVTNFITADLISAPLLWVGPLGIYLATFIVAFSARGRRPVVIATALAPAMATLLWVPFGYSALWPTLPLLLLELFGFAVIALTLHGALAADRPGPSRLTFFYLVVSAGGVLGGAFVGFVAPVVFPGIWEYPILLVAALAGIPLLGGALSSPAPAAGGPATAAGEPPQSGPPQSGGPAPAAGEPRGPAKRQGLDLQPFVAGARHRLAPFVIIGAACCVPIGVARPAVLVVVVPFLALGGLMLLIGAKPRMLTAMTAIVLTAVVLVQPLAPIYAERDFFGVVTVRREDGVTTMWHGTTPHGSQSTDPTLSREPRGYYDRRGPLGDVMALAQARGGQQIGIVGLGAGVIAAYERPIDHMTFFEIDPAVVRIAEDPSLFTYLSQAPNRPAVVVGDGRLELRKIPDASYDVLILDAFSGDAIPTHLITVEALRDDLRVLKPGGLLIVHVSNRYYDLAPAVVAGTEELGMTAQGRTFSPTQAEIDDGVQASEWVVATRSPDLLAPLAADGWSTVHPADRPITDDYPDVLRFARFGSWLTSG
ncbi:MAG: fused MFS/spermidine synthase [Candidatus Limnocylindrales bacterium]